MALSKVNPNFVNVSQVGGRRNLVINGAMQIHQRAESVSGATTNGYYTLDRWAMEGAGTFSGSIGVNMSISSGPDGFPNAFKYTAVADDTLSAAKYLMCNHKIEAQNLTHLKYGTSDAQSLTISFWVKSSATGNYALNLYSNDSGTARDITQLYTINAANTWEYKTLTFVGDPSGGINDDNGVGIWCQWFVRAGSDYTSGSSATSQAWNTHAAADYAVGHTADPIATSGGTWEITGVQIEVGDTATPFEHRSYGEELALCQRYYWKNAPDTQYGHIANGRAESTYVSLLVTNPQTMRAAPSFSFSGLGCASGTIGSAIATYAGKQTSLYQIGVSGGPTTGQVNAIQQDQSDGSGYLEADAEL